MFMPPIDSNQTFSNFSSLLEVAFALNMSYQLIPDLMKRLGQDKVQKKEKDILDDWNAEISDRKEQINNSEDDTNNEKLESEVNNFENAIKLLEDASLQKTKRYKISIFLSKVAPFFGLLAIIFLFFGALNFCPLSIYVQEKNTLVIVQASLVLLVLTPNIIAVWFQISHWNLMSIKLAERCTELESKLLNFEDV